MPKQTAVDALFLNREPVVREIYDRVMRTMAKVGPVNVEPKKTSIHLARATAFAGAHPKKAWLDLTIRTDKPLKSPRVRAQEQVSKNRWHQDVRLTTPKDVDAEVANWLKAAYALAID
jgi:hypothetical protein